MAGPASSGQHPAGPAPDPPGPGTEPAAAGTDAEPDAAESADGTGAKPAAAEGTAVTDAESAAAEAADAAGDEDAAKDEDEDAAGAKSAGLRAVFAALAANLGIAATKFVAFAITGSASMLAESVHSVADSGNQVLLLLGRNRANRASTEQHPFGYGRERYFYAFVVAVVLFTVGALFSIYEGIHKITHPEPVRDPAVAFVVLGIAIVLESFSLRTAVRKSSEQRDGHGWLAFIRRAKAPELPAILLEDMAALAGLFLATV